MTFFKRINGLYLLKAQLLESNLITELYLRLKLNNQFCTKRWKVLNKTNNLTCIKSLSKWLFLEDTLQDLVEEIRCQVLMTILCHVMSLLRRT